MSLFQLLHGTAVLLCEIIFDQDAFQNFYTVHIFLQGLQKLGHSIETSYSNIQKLVVKHLQV